MQLSIAIAILQELYERHGDVPVLIAPIVPQPATAAPQPAAIEAWAKDDQVLVLIRERRET